MQLGLRLHGQKRRRVLLKIRSNVLVFIRISISENSGEFGVEELVLRGLVVVVLVEVGVCSRHLV